MDTDAKLFAKNSRENSLVAVSLASALAKLCIAANQSAQSGLDLLQPSQCSDDANGALCTAIAQLFVSNPEKASSVSSTLSQELGTLRSRVRAQAATVESLQKAVIESTATGTASRLAEPCITNSPRQNSNVRPEQPRDTDALHVAHAAVPDPRHAAMQNSTDISRTADKAALKASRQAYIDLTGSIGAVAANVGTSAAGAAFFAGVEHHKATLQAAEAKQNEAIAMKMIAGAVPNPQMDDERTRILREPAVVDMVLPLRVWVTELQRELSEVRDSTSKALATQARTLVESQAKVEDLQLSLRRSRAETDRQLTEQQSRIRDYTRMQLENNHLAETAAKATANRKSMAKNANYSERVRAEQKACALHDRNVQLLESLRRLQATNDNMASQRRSHLDRLTSQQKTLDEMRQLMATAFDMKDTHQGSSFKLRVQSIQPEEVAALLSQYSSRAADVVAANREVRELKARLLKSQEQFDALQEQVNARESTLKQQTVKLSSTAKQLRAAEQKAQMLQAGQTRCVKRKGESTRPRSAQTRKHLTDAMGHATLCSTPIRPSSAAISGRTPAHTESQPPSAATLAVRDAKQLIKRSNSLQLDVSEFAASLALKSDTNKQSNPFRAGAADYLPSPEPSKAAATQLLSSPAVSHTSHTAPKLPSFSPQRRAAGVIETSYALSTAASPAVQWRFGKLMQGPGSKALISQVAAERLHDRLHGQVPDPDASRFQFDSETDGTLLAQSIRRKAASKMQDQPRMKMTGRFATTGKPLHVASDTQEQSADEQITQAAAKRAHFMDAVNEQLGKAIGREVKSAGVSTVVQGKIRAHTQYRIHKTKLGQDSSIKNTPKDRRPSAVASSVATEAHRLLDASGSTATEEFHKHMTADTRGHLLHDSGAVHASELETQIRESRMRINGQA